jgi:hypothetical protein
MKNGENTKTYSLDELKAVKDHGEDLTIWTKVDSTTQEEFERLITEDSDEAEIEWDWDNAQVAMP